MHPSFILGDYSEGEFEKVLATLDDAYPITYNGSATQADHDLTRVGTDRAFGKVIGQHSHPGMIFVFTDLPLHPDSRSGRDFVIMS